MNSKNFSLIHKIESNFLKKNLPSIKVGDSIRLGVYVQEAGKQRIQPFEGLVIACNHTGINATITVRKTFQGIGVERVFPLHAPCIATVEVFRHSKISRSKLYFFRGRIGKATRLKEKFN